MSVHYSDSTVTVHHGDCLEVMAGMPENSVDAIVTDPPYGLGFMGRKWDGLPPSLEWAEACYRVLKPGGHIAAFGGARTWHRLAVAIEDAGFEMRDSLAWLYGSGFSKAGLLGNRKGVKWCECGGNVLPYNHASETDLPRLRNNVHPSPVPRREGEDPGLLSPMQREATGRGMEEARAQGPGVVDGGVAGIIPAEDDRRPESSLEGRLVHRTGQGLQDDSQARTPPCEGERVRGGAPTRDGGDDRSPGHAPRGGASHQPRPGGQSGGEPEAVPGSHVALDDGALRGRAECPRCGGLDPAYRGFSTALKPAFEPIVLARKPLAEKTVARNVLAHGTGAINVDACRIGRAEGDRTEYGRGHDLPHANTTASLGKFAKVTAYEPNSGGRWPANVLLDHHAAGWVDEQSGVLKSGAVKAHHQRHTVGGNGLTHGRMEGATGPESEANEGGASRFFYSAKAPKSERPVSYQKPCNCETMKPCEDTSLPRDTADSRSAVDRSWNTSTSGNSSTALSQPGTTSTTGTGTSSTTHPGTSNSSPSSNTSESTPDANSEKVSGGSPAGSAENSSRSTPSTGTSAPKGGRSTDVVDPATSHEWSETSVCGGCGKPARKVQHETVKPLAIMRWLIRLVTPPGGTVLDPFAGSGTTIEAALIEGFNPVGIEMEPDYLPLIQHRIERTDSRVKAPTPLEVDPDQLDMLSMLDGTA